MYRNTSQIWEKQFKKFDDSSPKYDWKHLHLKYLHFRFMTLSSFTAQYKVQLIPPEHSNKTNKLVQMSIFENLITIYHPVHSHISKHFWWGFLMLSHLWIVNKLCVEWNIWPLKDTLLSVYSGLFLSISRNIVWYWCSGLDKLLFFFLLNPLLSCWIFFKTTYIKLKSSAVQSTHIWNQWLNVPTDVFLTCFFHHLACWSLAYSHSLCLMIGATQRW